MPLQLPVTSPADLTFKVAAEKQYLIFNLLAGGKVAWDRGDWEGAASRWEALVRTPGLTVELDALVRPLALAAREKAGGKGSVSLPPPPTDSVVTMTPMDESAPTAEPRRVVPTVQTVTGVISGGGSHGPGGAIIVLRRADGQTPKPRPTRVKAIVQKDKRFVPHVLAVPLGSTVEFRNEDEIFHSVFSLSKPNDFDLGSYDQRAVREQVFASPGVIHLLCNIHTSMQGWVYVSDSPWFAQADLTGRFTVKNVPDGAYKVEVWHEWSTKAVVKDLKVAAGLAEFTAAVEGDRQPLTFVPDKSGKPRQSQLGY
jgi:plastocyanin